MQTEKSQLEGKRIMPETRFYLVSGIIRWPEGWNFSVCVGDRWYIIFLTYYSKNRSFKRNIYNKRGVMANFERHSEYFVAARKYFL